MKQRKFAAFDIDGTLFRWQLFHELVFELKNQNLLDADTSLQIEKAFIDWRGLKTTWEDYEVQVVKSIEQQISSIEPAELKLAARKVVLKSGHKVYAYTAGLVKALKAQGYYLIAISGSQQEIVELFAQKYGFDHCIGAMYQQDTNGKYTGEYERFVVGNKKKLIQEVIDQENLTTKGSLAIGDSGGDIGMLEMVETPIAFNPSAELEAKAKEQGWNIVIERKNIAYTLELQHGTYVLADTRVF